MSSAVGLRARHTCGPLVRLFLVTCVVALATASPVGPQPANNPADAAAGAVEKPLKYKIETVSRLVRNRDDTIRHLKKQREDKEVAYEDMVKELRVIMKHKTESSAEYKNLASQLEAKRSQRAALEQSLNEDEERIELLEREVYELKHKQADPSLASWVARRVEHVGGLYDDEQAAKKLSSVVRGAVEDAHDSFENFEHIVEEQVHSPLAALTLCAFVFIGPCLLANWGLSRVTKALSYRQHVLIGHLFNLAFLAGLIMAYCACQVDPLVLIYTASPHYLLLIVAFFSVQIPVLLMLTLHCATFTSSSRERTVYLVQSALLSSTAVHASLHVRKSVVLGSSLPATTAHELLVGGNFVRYCAYELLIALIVVITSYGAATKREGLLRDVRDIVRNSVEGVGDAIGADCVVAHGSAPGTPRSHASTPRAQYPSNVKDIPEDESAPVLGSTLGRALSRRGSERSLAHVPFGTGSPGAALGMRR